MKNSFEQWIINFKRTHNGNDELGLFCIIVSLIINILSLVIGIPVVIAIFQLLSTLILGIAIYRFFSKNKSKRFAENYKLINFHKNICQWFRDQKYYLKESKTHKFFVCPNCDTVCRVPKHKGKIKIKCPHCGNTFIKKT